MINWKVNENGEEVPKENVYIVEIVKRFVVEAVDIDSAIHKYREGMHLGSFDSEIVGAYLDSYGDEDKEEEEEY